MVRWIDHKVVVAQRRLRELLSEADRGISPPERRYLLTEWLEKWLQDVIVPNRRRTTVQRYERMIHRHIVPVLGHVELAKLTPNDVQELETNLTSGGMAAAGVQIAHSILSGSLKYAFRMGFIQRVVTDMVTPPSKSKVEAWSPDVEQVQAMLAVAAQSGHYLWPCVHLVAYTGMRRGEALALRWGHFDLDGQSLQVTASLALVGGEFVLNPPKTDMGRCTVDLDDYTVAVLRAHRRRQRELAELIEVDTPEIVFPYRDLSGWCRPNNLYRFVAAMAKRAGCPGVTARSLRHFHASVALHTLGQNPVVVSRRMGHSTVSITQGIYGHALPGWQRETAVAVARVINPVP